MRKYLIAMTFVVLFLAILIPFASTSPDGLEKVAESLEIEERVPMWNGLMFDYSVEAIGNSYVSTLLAGILGTAVVLVACLVLGKVLVKKGIRALENRV